MPTDRAYKLARQTRRTLSLPEGLLWRLLRRSGLHVRRQHPIGPFVADFYCASAKLVIEVDGLGHLMSDRPRRDVRRSQWLRERGFREIRLPASEVLRSPEACADAILTLCRTPPPLPSAAVPLPTATR